MRNEYTCLSNVRSSKDETVTVHEYKRKKEWKEEQRRKMEV